MAPRWAVSLVILLAVSLLFAGRGQTEGDQQVPSTGGEGDPRGLPAAGGRGGYAGLSGTCVEFRLYRGPCVQLECAAACLLQFHNGGHCTGKLYFGRCYCFVCN